jgi:hypothetical protein
MSTQHDETPLAADLLHGVGQIAQYLGMSERQIHWQIRRGAIPIARLGRLIVGSKSKLREHLTPKPVASRGTSAQDSV